MKRLLADPNEPEEAAAIRRRQPLEQSRPEGGSQTIGPKARRGDSIPSISAMALAFLASQHHNFMMLLLALGLSGAAMSFMTAAPILRDVMLGLSVAMIAIIAWQVRDSRRPRSMRIMGAVSIAVTIGLSAWSITRFGW
jgi:hypothetical protein